MRDHNAWSGGIIRAMSYCVWDVVFSTSEALSYDMRKITSQK